MNDGPDATAPTPAAQAPETHRHALARLPDEWVAWLQQLGEPAFRAKQVFRWLHRDGVTDVQAMTNLSKALRERLAGCDVGMPAAQERAQRSNDGTRKLLLRLADDLPVECVLIPRSRDDEADEASDDPDVTDLPPRPVTLCVSTQVGCAMGCVFCASGQAGLKRGLGAHEVLSQVLMARRHLDAGERITNLVFMGMGEPLHHYAETARSIRLLTHPEGMGMSPRRITVSTVGLIPGIEKLGRDFQGKIGLAVSLHAPDDETRNAILPMNRRFPLADLMRALAAYPLPTRRRITIEYTLIRGVNDQVAHATQLASLLRGLPSKVNLIPMNPIRESALQGSDRRTVERFRAELAERRVSCSIRQTRGDDVDAACGQLALGGRR